ncbi:MAG: DUF3429 domain-containing protein [Janthinobacterium lividum]
MRRLPLLAIVLGIAGLIPFVACAVGILIYPNQVPVPRLVQALIGYSAVILSFLGAVHWGLALAARPLDGPAPAGVLSRRLTLGVLPALVGWAAILIPMVASPVVSLVVLLLGFVLTAVAEARAARAGLLPPGYMALRWLLTAVVVVCLVASILVRL